MRRANLQAALNLLRHGDVLSSPEMAERLDVHPSTVTRLMGALRKAGLVQGERGESDNTVGRPPNLWRLHPEAGYALGLSVHADVLSGVLVDLAGRVLARRTLLCDPPMTTENLPATVRDLALSLSDEVPSEKVLGVGVGASGVVDPEEGILRKSGGLLTADGAPATDYALRDLLEGLLPWPVRVANDTHAAALAVYGHQTQIGELPAKGSLLYFSAGVGLWGFGVGVVLDGRLYTGAHGVAGELAHPVFLTRPPRWDELPRRALGGEPEAARQVVEALGPVLCQLASLAVVFDADCVVLGGAFATLGTAVRDALAKAVQAMPSFGHYWAGLLDRAFILDPLRPDTEPLGAAQLMLDGLFYSSATGAEPGPLVQAAQEV